VLFVRKEIYLFGYITLPGSFYFNYSLKKSEKLLTSGGGIKKS